MYHSRKAFSLACHCGSRRAASGNDADTAYASRGLCSGSESSAGDIELRAIQMHVSDLVAVGRIHIEAAAVAFVFFRAGVHHRNVHFILDHHHLGQVPDAPRG